MLLISALYMCAQVCNAVFGWYHYIFDLACQNTARLSYHACIGWTATDATQLISQLPCFTALLELDLAGSSLDASGGMAFAKVLSDHAAMPCLRSLQLSNNPKLVGRCCL